LSEDVDALDSELVVEFVEGVFAASSLSRIRLAASRPD